MRVTQVFPSTITRDMPNESYALQGRYFLFVHLVANNERNNGESSVFSLLGSLLLGNHTSC
jgi:hypothetical protein